MTSLWMYVFGVLGFISMMATFSYFCVFYAGVVDWISIDQYCSWQNPGLLNSSPFFNNLLLLLIFSVSHSVLARDKLKNIIEGCLNIPRSTYYRHLFLFQSSLLLMFICYAWVPQPRPVLWNISTLSFRLVLYGLGGIGMVMNVIAFFSLPVLEFVGICESVKTTSNGSEERVLVTFGVYSIVRHPMATGTLIFFWAHPTKTMGRLMVAATFTLYLFVAVYYFEEPSLVETFGDKYKDFQKKTPMLIPCLFYRAQTEPAKNK